MLERMPSLPELPDIDLKQFQYMDSAGLNLFDSAFTAADVDNMCWTYNFFPTASSNVNTTTNLDGGDEQLHGSDIKEENIDMDACIFSSICPNDLNSGSFLVTNNNSSTSQLASQFSSSSFSSSSPISSLSSTSSSPSNMNLLSSSSSTAVNLDVDFNPAYYQIDPPQQPPQFYSNNNNNSNEYRYSLSLPSASPSSSMSSNSSNSSSSSSPSHQLDYSVHNNCFASIKTVTPVSLKTASNHLHHNQPTTATNPQHLIMLDSSNTKTPVMPSVLVLDNSIVKQSTSSTSLNGGGNKSIKQLTKQVNKMNKTVNGGVYNPPSPPPSSSDTESDHSTPNNAASLHTVVTNQIPISKKLSTTLVKAAKLHQLKSGHSASLIKQINGRHQPYTIKSLSKQKTAKSLIKQQQQQQQQLDMDDMDSINLNNLNGSMSSNGSDDDCWPFFCSLNKLPSTGPLLLTEEEKRTLIQEGHQIPTQLPLSKSEEKILKKIRRKIKNKISAQESRRKKKEYVDSLEKRMESYVNQNTELKKRLEELELNNKKLLAQLQRMQSSLQSTSVKDTTTVIKQEGVDYFPDVNTTDSKLDSFESASNNASQFGTMLMVIVLFVAVLLGVWSPVVTKDQIASSTSSSTSTSSSSATTRAATSAAATVATAAATAAITTSSITLKTESLEDMVMVDDDDEAILDMDNDSVCSAPIQSASLARSKTGTTVELTKVRPSFIRKLPSQAVNSPTLRVVEESTSQATAATGQQIIILNLPSDSATKSTTKTPTGSSYRVINSLSSAKTTTPSSKIQTRFRVINNSTTSGSSAQTPTNLIKLNTTSSAAI